MRKIVTGVLLAMLCPAGSVTARADDTGQALSAGILELADNLETCTRYQATFTHPFNGEEFSRNISGMAEDKCIYTEGMPGGGRMTCKYPASMLSSIATHYRNLATADSVQSKTSISTSDSGYSSRSVTIIEGVEVADPLQYSLDNGICTISGYSLNQ